MTCITVAGIFEYIYVIWTPLHYQWRTHINIQTNTHTDTHIHISFALPCYRKDENHAPVSPPQIKSLYTYINVSNAISLRFINCTTRIKDYTINHLFRTYPNTSIYEYVQIHKTMYILTVFIAPNANRTYSTFPIASIYIMIMDSCLGIGCSLSQLVHTDVRKAMSLQLHDS